MIDALEAIAHIIEESSGSSKDKAAAILFSLATIVEDDDEGDCTCILDDALIRAEAAEDEAADLRCELQGVEQRLIDAQEYQLRLARLYLGLAKRLVVLKPGEGKRFDEMARQADVIEKLLEENRKLFKWKWGQPARVLI